MRECSKCHIQIINDEMVCPLCGQVLNREEAVEGASKDGKEDMYPNLQYKEKTIRIAGNIFILIALVLEVLLILINYVTSTHVWWSLICGVGLVYACVTLKNMFSDNSGHVMKLFVQSVGAIILALVIDYILGYRAWSVNYAIPTAILTVDGSVVLLMIINRKNWQSYILMQILMIVVSVIMVLLIGADIVTKPVLTLVAAGVSLGAFVCTYIIGYKKAEVEIKRRFHF